MAPRRIDRRACTHLRRDIFLREACTSACHHEIERALTVSPFGDGPLDIEYIVRNNAGLIVRPPIAGLLSEDFLQSRNAFVCRRVFAAVSETMRMAARSFEGLLIVEERVGESISSRSKPHVECLYPYPDARTVSAKYKHSLTRSSIPCINNIQQRLRSTVSTEMIVETRYLL